MGRDPASKFSELIWQHQYALREVGIILNGAYERFALSILISLSLQTGCQLSPTRTSCP